MNFKWKKSDINYWKNKLTIHKNKWASINIHKQIKSIQDQS